MTVKRRKDTQLAHVFMHKIADIRGGVSVNVSELAGDFLYEGSVISAPTDGICHVVKIAKLTAAATATDTEYKVAKGHHLSVGDIIMAGTSGVAVAITAITTTNTSYDLITVGTTLGVEIEAGGFIIEAAEASSDASTFKYTPFALVGTGKPVIAGTNLDTDAWVIGVTTNNPLPDCVADLLKGIINY